MFKKFTQRARKVILLAQEVAKNERNEYLGTEHILWAILKDGGGVAIAVIQRMGIDTKVFRNKVFEILPPAVDYLIPKRTDIPMTVHAKKILEASVEEARSLGHSYVGTEHMLLGLCRIKDSQAGRMLSSMNIRYAEARKTTILLLKSPNDISSIEPTVLENPLEGINLSTAPKNIKDMGVRFKHLINQKRDAIEKQDFEQAVEFRDLEEKLRADIDKAISELDRGPKDNSIQEKSLGRTLPEFSSDNSSHIEKDCLGISADYNALAALICSKEMNPPLSIGLFGDWGSGKSFFMNRTKEAIDTLRHKSYNQSCWSNIVHVPFNAWHYIDSNLWASLVSNILDSVQSSISNKPNPTTADLESTFKELKIAQEALETAETAFRASESFQKQSEGVYKKIAEECGKAEESLANELYKDTWGAACEELKDNHLSGNDISFIKDIGHDVSKSHESAMLTYKTLSTFLGRLKTVLTLMRNRKQKIQLLILSSLIILIVLIFSGGALDRYLKSILDLGVTVITPIGGFISWIGFNVVSLNKRLNPITTFLEKAEGKFMEVERTRKTNTAKYEKELARKHQEHAEAVKNLEKANQALHSAQRNKEDAINGKYITKYIMERAKSDDYRKHLGIIATIHNDLKTLSNFIEKHNALHKEKPELDQGINRIVLYIDDLDRCPPEKVVEVLQAVHLLLAFPLFVVIVAVDARWLASSLDKHYDGMLSSQADGIKSKKNGGESPDTKATAYDYLEKIFQIPYWVKPIDNQQSSTLVKNLIGKDTALPNDNNLSGITEPRFTDSATTSVAEDSISQAETTFNVQNLNESEFKPILSKQHITPEESAEMEKIAPLAARSPRSLKRFVNSYRLIKSMVPLDEGDDHRCMTINRNNFKAPMLLLALSVGAPEKYLHLLESLEDSTNLQGKLKDWVESSSHYAAEESIRLKCLFEKENADLLELDLSGMHLWAKRISQFSFIRLN